MDSELLHASFKDLILHQNHNFDYFFKIMNEKLNSKIISRQTSNNNFKHPRKQVKQAGSVQTADTNPTHVHDRVLTMKMD